MAEISRLSWDVIVVGAGIGGMTAAARLRRAGLRVLVVDRNHHVGGTAFVYTRGGYTFPMGPLGFSSTEKISRTLQELDIMGSLNLTPVHYRLMAFGLDVPLSRGFSGLIEHPAAALPELKEGIRCFFNQVISISDSLKSEGDLSHHDRIELLKWAARTPAGDYLTSIISDPRWQRILGSIGTEKPYSSLLLLAAMWSLITREGIFYPAEGMKMFCENLAKGVTGPESNPAGSGEIRLGTGVKRIFIEHGRVQGVVLETGEVLRAGSVISNADYKQTFLRLVAPEHLPTDWLRQVSGARQTASNLQIALGLETERVNLGLFDHASRIITRRGVGDRVHGSPAVNWKLPKIDPELLLEQEMELSLWSRDHPELAPRGGQVLIVRTAADFQHFSRFRPAWKKRNPAYGPYKTGLARAVVAGLEKMIPGLTPAIRVMDVSTPLTFEEMGGRSQGAVAGWSWDFSGGREQQARELVRTPIKALYMTGYQAFSALYSGGVATAMESGSVASRAVLEQADPDFPVLP